MSTALGDLVVIDLSTEFFGGVAAALLADFGARVIRVENTGVPAPIKNRDGMRPQEVIDAHAELAHRNKQSIALDLETDEGLSVLKQLIARSDVLMTDLPFAEQDAKGLDYESLCGLRADIIVARGSGFGPNGPDRDLPAIDELAASRVGLMSTLGEPGQPPVYSGTGQMHTAVMLAFGALMALVHRAKSGEGQVVDTSLFAGNMYSASLDLQAYLAVRADRILEPVSRLDMGNPMSGPSYPCSDGRWVTLAMPDTDRWWPIFSEVMGLDIDDPRFDTHEKRCGDNRLEMMQLLDELFVKQPGSHWEKEFAEKKMSADLIETYDYPAHCDQARVNRYVLDLDHPSHGEFQSLGFPIMMSDNPARLRSMAPCRGQHTEEVLEDFLGLDADQRNRS
ncbi:MAG: CoA transferase [Myxococcota bacterium]|jgi:formyl-CoA transferase|nr:CoA transferase [Myxococcota bacterium]